MNAKYIDISKNIIKGGLIGHVNRGPATYKDLLIAHNKNDAAGGYFSANAPFYPLTIENATIVDNAIKQSTAIRADSVRLRNSVIGGIPSLRDFLRSKRGTEVSHTYFDDFDCAKPVPFPLTCGPGNIFGGDPMFRDTAALDYRLRPCSPLVDAGDDTGLAPDAIDLDGKPRRQGGRVDMGAYESAAFTLVPAPVATPTCAGLAQGRVSFGAANGCAPYTYAWRRSDGATGLDTVGLAAGTYFFNVTDGRGRALRDTVSIAESAPTLLAEGRPLRCGSLEGGGASARAAKGTPPYTYLWSNAATGEVLQELRAGLYGVTLRDALGCTDTTTVQVDSTGQLLLAVDGRPISCFGRSDGILSVRPLNGAAPYTYRWNGGQADSLLSGLGPGQYAATVTDTYGCAVSYGFMLEMPEALRLSAQAQDATAPNRADGGAFVSGVLGGTPPYAYLWDNGRTDAALSQLTPGFYTVTVTDARGCTDGRTVEVKYTSGVWAFGAPIELRLYPNPAMGQTLLEGATTFSEPLRLRLYDTAGRCVKTEPVAHIGGGAIRHSISLEGLPPGQYQVVLETEQGAALGRGRVAVLRGE